MKILLVGSFRYEMYAPAFAYGFSQLGCDVDIIDYEKYHLRGEGVISKLHNRIQDRYHYGLLIRKYNKDLIKRVQEERPDIVFLYRCYHIYNKTLNLLKNDTFIVSYNNDDPFSGIPSKSFFRYHITNAYLCHLNYVYRRKNIKDYAKLGITNTKILLPYYLSRQNIPLECEKDIPIAFIGHYEDDGRDELLKAAIESGLPVRLFGGEGWKKSIYFRDLSPWYHPSVTGKAYNALLNRVRILIVFFSKINHDTYTRRCFEIPAAKGLMLSEFTEDMNGLYPDNECAVYFKNKTEFISRAKWLLNNPKERERIALNGYKRVQELGASETDRCKEVINDYIKLQISK